MRLQNEREYQLWVEVVKAAIVAPNIVAPPFSLADSVITAARERRKDLDGQREQDR